MGGVDISGTKETTRSYGLVHFGSVIQNVQKCRPVWIQFLSLQKSCAIFYA